MSETRSTPTGATAQAETAEDLPLVAYYEGDPAALLRVVPATRSREFIDNDARHARHCLPLMMANQSGWFVLNNAGFEARWTGDSSTEAVDVVYDGVKPKYHAHSIFGHGILTFMIPYLFRTPARYNLLARGPANMPKDGISPLEGLVETDWAVATFTMNWKMTRPGSVRFERDEPVCMLVPEKRGLGERFAPRLRRFDEDPELRAAKDAFNQGRHERQVQRFIAEQIGGAPVTFERDYLRGLMPDGSHAQEHQRKRRFRPFEQG